MQTGGFRFIQWVGIEEEQKYDNDGAQALITTSANIIKFHVDYYAKVLLFGLLWTIHRV